MREIISVHIGQAGVEIGNKFWELSCYNHGIAFDGTIKDEKHVINKLSADAVLFDIDSGDKLEPRAVFADLEPKFVDTLRTGKLSGLVENEFLLSGKEESGSLYALGRYKFGRELFTPLSDRIRRQAEQCDHLQGFLLYHSLGGGTGTGVTSLVMEDLSLDFGKSTKVEFSVYPYPYYGHSVVEPYNAILYANTSLEHSAINFMLDNEAMQHICKTKINIQTPNYSHMDSIMVQYVSSITTALSSTTHLNSNLNNLQANLAPFPRVHFPVISLAPLRSKKEGRQRLSLTTVSSSLFHETNQSFHCDASTGVYMGLCFHYRGASKVKDVDAEVQNLKKRRSIKLADWAPREFRFEVNPSKPMVLPDGVLGDRSFEACLLSNTTAISTAWKQLGLWFDQMYKRKAYLHWYLNQGMELDEFAEARENLRALQTDYDEVEKEI